jgi:hypothetical protein
MARRARTDRTRAENIAIRAQVDSFTNQGLPLDQAQAVAFKMFSRGEISVTPQAKPAKSSRGLLRNLSRRAVKTAAVFTAADIASGRRAKSSRKRKPKTRKK